jgi:hypothetical protein
VTPVRVEEAGAEPGGGAYREPNGSLCALAVVAIKVTATASEAMQNSR